MPSPTSTCSAPETIDPSTSDVPAGKCSSKTRKSRSHSGRSRRSLRQAETSTRTRPPSGTWVARLRWNVGFSTTWNPGSSVLAVEFRVGGGVVMLADDERLAADVLVGLEVAGEAAEEDGVAEFAAPLDVEMDPVPASCFQDPPRHDHRLPLRGAGDVGLEDFDIIDRDDQSISVLRRLRLAEERGERRERRALRRLRLPAGAEAMGEDPFDGPG